MAALEEPKIPEGFTPKEEKELKRVFDNLCDYAKKSDIRKGITQRIEILNAELGKSGELEAETKLRRTKGTKFAFDDRVAKQMDSEITALKNELASLNQRADMSKKVTALDLQEVMTSLGKPTNWRDVEEMIWEVDENLDQCVDWEEFRLMFKRNINDKTGLEASKLYNLVQFLIYDKNEVGKVSVDQVMNMLYARYGRFKMEAKLRELFGEEMTEAGGSEMNFLQFLNSVEKIQLKTFWNSPLGKLALTSRNNPHAVKEVKPKHGKGSTGTAAAAAAH